MRAAGRLAAGLALLALSAAPAAESGLFPTVLPGSAYASFDFAPLCVLVPREQAEALRPLAARAAQIYRHLAADAGLAPGRLTLVLTDDFDAHNGFSSVAPDNVVVVWLAPAPPRSGIFDGRDHRERTIIHELAHHLSNDRSHGVRRALETVFGRVLPSEPLSMLWAYLTVPAHVTQPSFWHEGLAQWAETAYADPASPWAGRGRDSLTHAVWRLDAEAGAIPDAADWRPGWHAWPFGNRVYLYGLAYTRWLEAAYGRQASIWALVDAQARQWPFLFDDGVDAMLRRSHASLIAEARADLLAEQRRALAAIRTRPVTAIARLTPDGRTVGAPAWMPDGRLAAALIDPWGKDRIALVAADGAIETTRLTAMRDAEVRALRDGTWVYADSVGLTPVALSATGTGCPEAAWQVTFARGKVVLVEPGGRVRVLDGLRLLQPDVRRDGVGWEVAAVRFTEAGGQELVRCRVDPDGGQSPWTAVPTRDRPWAPAFRPGGGLAWVETHADGSRLVLADGTGAEGRRVLASVRGRILHPAWEADGSGLFLCADHTGVANAWHLRVDRPGELTAVTNVVGAVTACVPSPDGGELAVLALDRQGPYLGRIANRPAEWPGTLPAIPLAWPAPVAALAAAAPPAEAKRPTPLPAAPAEPAPPAGDYQGLAAIRPLYWTPTTQVTARGGYGVALVAADPLRHHEVVAAAGAGAAEGSGVGQASWLVARWPLQVQGLAWRDERAYGDRLWGGASGRTYDYVENVTGGELRLGEGLAGTARRVFAYAAAGLESARVNRDAAQRYAGEPVFGGTPFTGEERYAELVAGYASTTLFPTSYSRDDGARAALSWRHSGFGGDLEGERLLGIGSYVFSLWPEAGHQLVAGGAVGWSAGPQPWLQGRFQVGGASGLDLPRGYTSMVATGDHLLAWTTAYRLPVWRPWAGLGTTPFALRQVVLEGFLDAAKASSDHPGGDGWWYRSAGGELRFNIEVWSIRLNPGLGIARQLDGAEATEAYFTLEYAR